MPDHDRSDEALAWLVRLTEPQPPAATWTGFSAWLEADPANAAAYDALAAADAALSHARAANGAPGADGIAGTDFRAGTEVSAGNDNARSWRRGGMAAAAACAGFALFGAYRLYAPARIETFVTRPGEQRQIALNDGSTIILNGGSRLTLDRSADREAGLDAGEAIFAIRHDPARPFRVRTAAGEVTDVGTTFNVRLDDRRVAIAVREGAVRFGSGGRTAAVDAGYRLTVAIGDAGAVLAPADARAIGGWRTGMLEYDGARLSAVALDLSRSLGVPVRVRDDIAERRFTGIIQVDRRQAAMFRSLETLLGAHATRSAAGWTLNP